MSALRYSLLPVGALLIVLGVGNWYIGHERAGEHERLLATRDLRPPAADFEDFRELNPRTSATLLRSLERGGDQSTLINAKLDFYKVVQSGGRMLVLLGFFCAVAGLIRSWHRQRLVERIAHPVR